MRMIDTKDVINGKMITMALADVTGHYSLDKTDIYALLPEVKQITVEKKSKLVFEDTKIVNAKKVDIPVYRYLNYQIFNSKGQKLSVSKSKRGTILVNKRSGDKIVVRYVPSKGEIFTRVISIITWIILLSYAFIREGYRSKEQERLFNE